eukprot:TRINITY_DN374_c0_g1_i4.p3 TRINITY_DN374_c0_g1~~TRINITY_DN374_c0_g1_i4.p3  ORF type:complete len:117 (-),score=11.13 TRINITY_DN374_c0_g1_i4:62-412(-)
MRNNEGACFTLGFVNRLQTPLRGLFYFGDELLSGVQQEVFGNLTLPSRESIFNFQFLIFNFQFLIFNFQFLIFNFQFLIFNFQFRGDKCFLLLPEIKKQTALAQKTGVKQVSQKLL